MSSMVRGGVARFFLLVAAIFSASSTDIGLAGAFAGSALRVCARTRLATPQITTSDAAVVLK